MYFHIIWIKEKDWKKHELDMLLHWWDEEFIRKFLANRWVVIVSIVEYKEDPNSFWNIIIDVIYNDSDIKLIIKWEDLAETTYFIAYLWINPIRINFVENPIPDDKMKEMIDSTLSRIKEEEEKIKREKELEELNEQKKYEETGIKDWLKIINSNIDHIEQLIKAWEGIIAWNELKELDGYLNEMKKIRLWTNFNKMASLVLDVQPLVKNAEKQVIDANASHKFLVDSNSITSNIDVLTEYFSLNRLSYRAKFQPSGLKPTENIANMLWTNTIFLNLLRRDMSNILDITSMDEVFRITMNVIEYIILTAIVIVSLMWLFTAASWMGNFSLYLLPALWWLWLLLYLFNNLWVKWIIVKFVWFVVLAVIYWRWLILLLNTFAL